jgi:hypothetical protein
VGLGDTGGCSSVESSHSLVVEMPNLEDVDWNTAAITTASPLGILFHRVNPHSALPSDLIAENLPCDEQPRRSPHQCSHTGPR